MSLDLAKVAQQVAGMVARLRDGRAEKRQHLEHALCVLTEKSADLEGLRTKIAASKTSWLVADPVERPDQRHPAPPSPAEFTVLAVDGSQIEVDRHRSARCYLLNMGLVSLHYGEKSAASLDSRPRLYSEDSDLFISSGTGRVQAVEGPLLGLKRSAEECRHLAELAKGLPPGSIGLALLDGSLILWRLETERYPPFVTDALLKQGFLAALEDMRQLNAERRLAVASYISRPRSTDVVNVLRLLVCPHEVADCDRYCPDKRDCDTLAGVLDMDLFSGLLAPGERSAVFISPSEVQKHYGAHRVHFFYLRLEDEVARVEVPQWLATSQELLDLTHALVLDQCQRGQGYPVALSEAHEQAVVTNADREDFWELVDSISAEERLPGATSAKSQSKRTRWV